MLHSTPLAKTRGLAADVGDVRGAEPWDKRKIGCRPASQHGKDWQGLKDAFKFLFTLGHFGQVAEGLIISSVARVSLT